ncbi:cell envelope protein SmpA [Pseudomonas fluorescens]|uniref:Cell envelope protein SmpA n=1 Tax=Pseudomonas fluorescens TaxID=294 RepID=A0A944HBE2_PSEFL|nr:cell envelope protein SmpA [Pseudomonas fluorescens]MBT2296363.1 cell envelope protein SmpA [Pseudomonas fluorescens]MBT2308700.1 cell envelope protein SmpA [Pseudomonas fluorescens]MBT2312689.1 cell envelope protein SmpA [Pseudomonas fluorescens]MBT2317818.1 cell envelope protein SmpA [Pseudomonas fluorescens]MBT2327986.1 cell envelope protein SmpA [Pseudomonas fluorescens]
MPVNRYLFLFAALPCLPLGAAGQSVHRCESSAGHVTFTTLSCRPGETLSLQQVHPPSPGTIQPLAETLLPEAEGRQTSGNKTNRKEPTVVGQLEDNCANLLNPRQRREAIIHRRVVSGMSQQDVESALGKPDSVKVRNSSTRYTYKAKKGRSAEIVFDEKGCVKGKS